MNDEWIEFDEGPAHTPNGMYASLNQIGYIVFSRQVFEAMEGPEAVAMLYNPKTDRIGLRPVSPLMPNAFPVKPKGPYGHRSVAAKPFMVKHDIRPDCTVRFRSPVVENGILILSLRDMVNIKRPKRAARRR